MGGPKRGDSYGPWFSKLSTIRAVNLDNGWPDDRVLAKQHLTLGALYTVANSRTWDEASDVELVQIPGVRFNTVHFELVK